MLEIERATPMMPSFLLPLSIPNLLAAQVTAEMGLDDLAVMRIWSLPELNLRCTISKPWMHRQGKAELTRGGEFLVLCDENLPTGFTSKHFHQYEFTHHQSRGIIDCYASSPTGIQIYDSRTGKVRWEKSDYPGVYSEYDQVGYDLVQFSKPRDSLLKQSNLLLHLPTKQLIETNHCPSAEQLANGRIQFASLNDDNDNPGFEIVIADRDQSRNRLQTIRTQPYFVRSAPQYVGVAYVHNVDRVPVWMHSLLRKWNWSSQWLDEFSHLLAVVDYSANRLLLSFPIPEREHAIFQMTDRWLVVMQDNEDSCIISVYPLPSPSWSPVWPYTAGLVVFLLACYLLRQRRLSRG